MRDTIFTVAAACVGMLVTSGIVAYAVASTEIEEPADAFVEELIDMHYAEVLDTNRR
jgi:hypothetical protein